jgi:GAG-pre-integrase domain
MGTIDILFPSGKTLSLLDALYIPSLHVCLLSILSLNCHNGITTHFNSDSCWITDLSGSTIATGVLLKSHNLYVLPQQSHPHTRIALALQPAQVLLSQASPTIETWHCHLGHCNIQTVINMAHSSVADEMPIDLFTLPAKCTTCILGK